MFQLEEMEEPNNELLLMFASTCEGPRPGDLEYDIMATMSRVPVVLAPAHGAKGIIHPVDDRRSVYMRVCGEWNEIQSGSPGINTY